MGLTWGFRECGNCLMYATTLGQYQINRCWTAQLRQGPAKTQLTNRSINPELSTVKVDAFAMVLFLSFDLRGVYVRVVSVNCCRTLQFISVSASVFLAMPRPRPVPLNSPSLCFSYLS